LPFLKSVDTDLEGFKDYLAFQFCLDGKTLFKGVQELKPGHLLTAKKSSVETKRYWQVYYNLDWDHTAKYFEDKVRELLNQSVDLHLRSDVPVGAYVSGGLDSSIIATLAASKQGSGLKGFTGKFEQGPEYDESPYARAVAKKSGFELEEISMTADDFIKNIRKVIYHLDYPVAGPGSFPQYMVSQLASRSRKVVLGGQGGDEIFGGYARYLIAYFEQCIKSAIEGNQNQGKNFIVTYESIIPNLASLKAYKPMIQEFWKEGLFEDLDRRYFRLINRAPTLGSEINWKALDGYNPYDSFLKVFRAKNVEKESYFDSMTHFDFKTLLPALLQVEDRVSMAHGVESRVPLLDHPLVELVATVPSNVKFKDGTMKNLFRNSMGSVLPSEVLNRKDKMGFPVPLTDWAKTEAKDFIFDVFSSKKAMSRDLINNQTVLNGLSSEPKYGRKLWGLLCLELWQQEFHDKQADYRRLITKTESPADLELRRV
ncbi:MAG: asparagine synthase (glutamine-hydrolyzing), partial [Bdellovibrionota bacterium]